MAANNESHQPLRVFTKGDKVWVPDAAQCYVPCTVKESRGGQVECFDDNYKSYNFPLDQVFPRNPEQNLGADDNTELMYLHDPNLLENLRVRYQQGSIYTYTAYILIAVNPYESLPIYGDEEIKKYVGQAIGKLPPHVYALSERAYRSLKNTKINQSVVVSGESGAGKTETCKHIMRYMAAVGGEGPIGTLDELEKKILDANPILESFGNAKTLRNNNSSRFGKFTELHFSETSSLSGASIETYLLEKSRLVSQMKNERSFHIFYQLIAGAPAALKGTLRLQSIENYKFLNASGCTTIEHVDDAKEFAVVQNAFKTLGINDADQTAIFSVLSALLYLGNVEFEQKEADSETVVSAASQHNIASAAGLLKLDTALLTERMLTRVMKAGPSETITITLSQQEACYARDSLAKFIYGELFQWIVGRINKSVPSEGAAKTIGILDISGFEIFECNSFEQFCINFANEKIQQYFNHQILRQEQKIYELEGLRYRQVEYKDNQQIIDLVEDRRAGIFALLNEECLMPKSTDKTFSIKVHTKHTSNEYLAKPKYVSGKKLLNEDEAFVVKHFAGEVIYETTRFLDKNNDTIHDELIAVLSESSDAFVKDLFPKPDNDNLPQFGPAGGRFKSVSATFQGQLTSLMDKLEATNSHFIRCIKPNGQQRPKVYNASEVMVQLQYSGMCAALVLMQAGFPTRISFKDLYERYAPKMPTMMSRLKPETFCEALLVALDLNGGKDFQMGLTKVFFRSGKLAFMDVLTDTDQQSVAFIVGKVRKWLAHKRFYAAGYAVVSLNNLNKQILGIRAVHKFRRAARVFVRIIRVWKGCLARVRKRLYTEEMIAKRKALEEERRRKEEEERLKKEAEEKKRREEEEEKIRKAEEEKRLKEEEKKRKEEEARKALEDKIQSLAESSMRLTSTLQTLKAAHDATRDELLKEQSLRQQAEEDLQRAQEAIQSQAKATEALQQRLDDERATMQSQLSELTSSAQGDKAALMTELEKNISAKNTLEQELGDTKETVRKLEEQLALEKQHAADAKQAFADLKAETTAAHTSLSTEYSEFKATSEGTVASLEEKLAAEQGNSARLSEDLSAKTDECATLTSDLRAAHAEMDDLRKQLATTEETLAGVRGELVQEKDGRSDDNEAAAQKQAVTEEKASQDLHAKDREIAALKADKNAHEVQAASDKSLAAKKIENLQGLLTIANDRSDGLDIDLKKAHTEIDALKESKDLLERERTNLISVAVKCQETQLKLRHIYSQFKKEEELVKLIYGDDSFNTLVKGCTKVSVLNKQGGSDVKKWANRHCILNDTFLLYYAGKGDKHPKGVIRIDEAKVENIDLAPLGKKNAFKVIASSGREYFFDATSEAEQREWVTMLDSLTR